MPISVVMCTFNGARFIEAQLDSILSQTHRVDELLVIDDGSEDQTVDIIQNRASADQRIKIFRNETRLGATKNFEKGFLLAKNEWIAISDQDDIWHPQKLEKLVQAINDESLLVYCDSQRFHNNPDFSVKPKPGYRRFEGKDGRNIFLFNTVSGHAMMMHKKLLAFVLPFKIDIYYDWVMAVAAAYNGGVVYVPETLVLQRMHDANMSTGDESQYGSPLNRKKFRQMVLRHLQQFVRIPNMDAAHRAMAGEFLRLWSGSIQKGFSLPLFFFLMKYRKQLYSFKKKKSLFFRHLKYSWWFCKN